MIFLYVLTALAVVVSFTIDRKKTVKAILVGMKKLWKITPPFLSILVGVSIVLYLIPNEMIAKYLGESSQLLGLFLASVIGSVTMMPGPIVYPLCGILLEQGVTYSVIAAFSTSMMMVGVLTFPLEKSYFGTKFALLRNGVSLLIALVIALIFSIVKGVL
jgi:uncharacterized membrane protein YraQ (UPF0718 family)